MEQNQFEFKPFNKVLVRSKSHEPWKISLYAYRSYDDEIPHVCINGTYAQCIPYNEETAHLLGTNEPYQKPEPKKWRIFEYVCNGQRKVFDADLTDDELKDFIEKAVINNKDITNVQIVYIE